MAAEFRATVSNSVATYSCFAFDEATILRSAEVAVVEGSIPDFSDCVSVPPSSTA